MAKHKEKSAGLSALLTSIKVERAKEANKKTELKSITDRIDDKAQRLNNMEKRDRYFFDNLCYDPKFGESADFCEFLKLLPAVATDYKRTTVLYLTFAEFAKKSGVSGVYRLNKNIMSKVVEHYLEDLNILKLRYDCPTVQLPKIAGLMTNLIVKCRPVVPVDIGADPCSRINELFAIHHALCICSDFSAGAELENFENSTQYDHFFEDMLYLLSRNFTPENLIMVFKTLCLYQFPSFLKKEVVG